MAPGTTSFLTFRLHGTIPAATGRALKAELRQAQEAGGDHRRTQKQFFAKFDAVLDRAPIGPKYFDHEPIAEVLAGEILMLEETGFVVHGFAILPNHAHLVLHLPASSLLSFAKAIDLLHLRSGTNCRRLSSTYTCVLPSGRPSATGRCSSPASASSNRVVSVPTVVSVGP